MKREEIVAFAKEVLLEQGSHPPTVLVELEGNEQPYVLPFINFPFDTTEERERGLFGAARSFAQHERKRLKGKRIATLTFICEGWGAQIQKDDPWVRPSRSPSRKEVLFILTLSVKSLRQEGVALEMLRAGGSLDLAPLSGGAQDEVRSSLLPAFLVGLQTAEQDEGMARARLRWVCEEYGVRRER